MTEYQLRDCPFCGSKPQLKTAPSGKYMLIDCGPWSNCNHLFAIAIPMNKLSEGVQAWNERVGDPSPPPELPPSAVAALTPTEPIKSDTVMLTHELIHAAATLKGGWTKAQIELLGLSYPPEHGWISTLCGKQVPATLYQQFYQAQHIRAKNKRSKQASN